MKTEMNTEITYYAPMFRSFVAKAIEGKDYNFIVLNDRKGAKFYEYMNLFPLDGVSYERKTYPLYRSCFRFMPPSEIRGAHVAVFDEITQHGNTLFYARKFFENMKCKVDTYALIRRRSYFNAGVNKETEAEVFLDLDDLAFARMTFQIFEYLTSKGMPLDVDHILLRIKNKEINIRGFIGYLSQFGHLFFVPTITSEEKVYKYSLDSPSFFELSEYIKTKSVRKEGIEKLRFYAFPRKEEWYLTPIVFPMWDVDLRKPFGGVADKGFCDFISCTGEPQIYKRREKAVGWYQLIAYFLGSVMTENFLRVLLCFDPSIRKEDIEILDEDVIRNFGVDLGEKLLRYLDERIMCAFEDDSLYNTFLTNGLENSESKKPEFKKGTIHIELIKLLREKHKDDRPWKGGLLLTEILSNLSQILNREVLTQELDILLDKGKIKPNFIAIKQDQDSFIFKCGRSYKAGECTEFERIPYETECIIPFLLRELQKKDPSFEKGVPDYLTQKILVNFKHDWERETKRKIPIQWKPYIYGLMPGLQMSDGWKYLTDLAEKSLTFEVIKKKKGKKEEIFFASTEDFDEVDLTKLFSGTDISSMQVLADIYYRIYKETGRVQELTTLSSCRDEELTYICCYAELELWHLATNNLIWLIERHLDLLQKKPTIAILDDNLKRMALLHAQLDEKILSFREIEDTRRTLENTFADYEFRDLAFSIIYSLRPGPMSPRLRKMEEAFWIMKRFTGFLRYSLFLMGLAKDERPPEKKLDEQGKPKSLTWYLNKLHEAFGEAQESIDPETIEMSVNERNVEKYIGNVSIIYEQFKKWTDRWINKPAQGVSHEIRSIDSLYEDSSKLTEDLNDLKKTAGIRKGKSPSAPVVFVDIMNFAGLGEVKERDHALLVVRNTLEEIIPGYNVVDKKWQDIGADGFCIVFDEVSSSREALNFAMRIQHKLLRTPSEPPVKVSIGMDKGEVVMSGAKPIDNYSLNSYYMTLDKVREGFPEIHITGRIYDELNLELKQLCTPRGTLEELYQRIGQKETFHTMIKKDLRFGENATVYIVKWENWELGGNC